MKTTVGISSIDELEGLIQEGVEEIYCGYVPYYYLEKYTYPINRREVLLYLVQVGSLEELKILSTMCQKHHIQIAITLNAIYYIPEQLKLMERIVKDCLRVGIDTFIVGDLSLLVYLHDLNLPIHIHISGELGEVNTRMLDLCMSLGASRIIFHRKVSLADMKKCIDYCGDRLEYEAFILNEMCHYHGGFCMSMHVDELCHMCLVRYKLDQGEIKANNEYEGIGESGCGLCALYQLNEIGVNVIKIVSRGNLDENTLEDVKCVNQAIEIMHSSNNEKIYIHNMKEQLFHHHCSGICYYRNEI